MNKEEILNVIEEKLRRSIDEIPEGKIDPMRKFTDYGANSLDIVEIVSGTMRQLKIKIPRTELADIKNIDALAQKFIDNAPVG